MDSKHLQVLIFLTCVNLHVEISETCQWNDPITIAGQCFLYNSTSLSYSEAEISCELRGGVLAKVFDREVLQYLSDHLSNEIMWIGANDIDVEGTWMWENGGEGSAALSDLWLRGEPSNATENEDCAMLYKNSGAHFPRTVAESCNNQEAFLCMEKVTCRWKESISSLGQCFLLNSTQLSYDDAKKSCKLNGGVLAKLQNAEQLYGIMINYKQDDLNVWIGADDIQAEGTWVWVDGGAKASELYGLWMSDEPKNVTGKEDCAMIHQYRNAVLGKYIYDVFSQECDGARPFLCMEKDLTTTTEPATSTSTTSDPATTNIGALASTSKVPLSTLMKCGANLASFNALLFLNLFAFKYLFI